MQKFLGKEMNSTQCVLVDIGKPTCVIRPTEIEIAKAIDEGRMEVLNFKKVGYAAFLYDGESRNAEILEVLKRNEEYELQAFVRSLNSAGNPLDLEFKYDGFFSDVCKFNRETGFDYRPNYLIKVNGGKLNQLRIERIVNDRHYGVLNTTYLVYFTETSVLMSDVRLPEGYSILCSLCKNGYTV